MNGIGTIRVEGVRKEDLYNPFLYVAIQNASQVQYEMHLKVPGDDNLWDSNIMQEG
jgi:hypothetical protein